MNWDYPDLYYRVYPKINQSIDKHFGEDCSYEYITDSKINMMVDEIYEDLCKDYPEIGMDPMERRGRGRARAAQRIYYGRGRLVRDLITIFLISELLRRNRIDRYSSPMNPY